MQIVTADQAAALIQDRWTITISGFERCGGPEALLEAIERRFRYTAKPKGLKLFFGSACGDGVSQGLNRIAQPGLVKHIVGSNWTSAPCLAEVAATHGYEIESWPQSVISKMYRAIAAKRSYVLSAAGIGTFLDPRKKNLSPDSQLGVSRVTLQEYGDHPELKYPVESLNCALLRGTRSDKNGNITMEHEANLQDQLAQAQAVRTCGGIVIVQVKDFVTSASLPPRSIHIPGHLVDFVVVAKPELHWQTYGEVYNFTYSGEWYGNTNDVKDSTHSNEAERIIARRAALQLLKISSLQQQPKTLMVSAGTGLPETVARHAIQDGQYNNFRFTWTLDSGVVGGTPVGTNSSGACAGPLAFVSTAEQFDFYNSGGIDVAFIEFGAIDGMGRVDICNSTDLFTGVGGFIDITQSAKQLIFLGNFENVTRSRFVDQISRVCFDPKNRIAGDRPLIITERAVLSIDDSSLVLLETAPGIDVTRDIIQKSGCPIRTPTPPKLMPASVFRHEKLEMPFAS